MPMPPIEKARTLHSPAGREPVRDHDLLAWCAALPQSVNLAEETQHLRNNYGALLDMVAELQDQVAELKDRLDATVDVSVCTDANGNWRNKAATP